MSDREEVILQKIKNVIKNNDPTAEVILYGSHARGTAHHDSDWDILILLNKKNIPIQIEQKFRHSLLDIELEIGEVISVLVYAKKDWQGKLRITPFYENINHEGIVL